MRAGYCLLAWQHYAAPMAHKSARGWIARVIPDTLNVRERPGDAQTSVSARNGAAHQLLGRDRGSMTPVEGGEWLGAGITSISRRLRTSTPLTSTRRIGAPPLEPEVPPAPIAEGSPATANDVNLRAGPGHAGSRALAGNARR
jgi:hypothetical protein